MTATSCAGFCAPELAAVVRKWLQGERRRQQCRAAAVAADVLVLLLLLLHC